MIGGPVIRSVAVMVATAAVLAGCSSDTDRPAALPSLTGSPIGSAAPPSAAAPSRTDPKAQVEAAVRAYFAAANTALAEGVTSGLREATADSCGCLALVAAIEKSFSVGSADGAHWDLINVRANQPEGGVALAAVTYVAAPYKEVDKSGSLIQSYPGHRNEALIQLVFDDGGWLVANFDNTRRDPL